MGWDAFGLPAENYAIKTGIHPSITTKNAIETYKRQINELGYSFDWNREINTTDPNYYKWTQWIFLKLWEEGLAELREEPIWWSEALKSVLANEEIIQDANGNLISERGEHPVEKKLLKQWVLKITDYADKLSADLDTVDFPESIKNAQRNWIGRSEGAQIKFQVIGIEDKIEVFTTRPDTLSGVTYLVIAPEHPLANILTTDINRKDSFVYLRSTKKKTDIQRSALGKEKTGVFTGSYAINPLTKKQLPIWIADYVLMNYGTGAIMAVPAHDQRDFEFAKKYKIDLVRVIKPEARFYKSILMGGTEITEQELNNLKIEIVKTESGTRNLIIPEGKIEEYKLLIKAKLAVGFWNELVGKDIWFGFKSKENNFSEYTLTKENHTEINNLTEKFNGTRNEGNVWSWLASISFYNDLIVFGELGKLENSAQFTGLESNEAKKKIVDWLEENNLGMGKVIYKLRDWLFSRQRYWGEPIPLIHKTNGEVEEIINTDDVKGVKEKLPLLLPEVPDYTPASDASSPLARNSEWVETTDSEGKLAYRETNTMPNWAGSCWYYLRYIDPHNDNEFAAAPKLDYWLPVDMYFGGSEHTTLHLLYSRFWHKFLYDQKLVPTPEPYARRMSGGVLLGPDGYRMSKSKGNIINPDDKIKEYGADALRMYINFMGPYDATIIWSEGGLKACKSLIDSIYQLRLVVDKRENSPEFISSYHSMVKKVSEMIDKLKTNTVISEFMIFVSQAKKKEYINQEIWSGFIRLLAPFAVFIAEELWEEFNLKIGAELTSVHIQNWPTFSEDLIANSNQKIGIQINGKLRTEIMVAKNEAESTVKEKVLESEIVIKWINNKEIKKFIYIPGRIVNLVV